MRTVSGDPWAKAVDAYAAGDDKSAILHLGAAIYAEPHREELRMLLSGLLSRQSNPLALFPERPLNPAEALVYALALDWVGRKEEALRLILKLSARPQPALLPVLVAATAGSLFTTISPRAGRSSFQPGCSVSRIEGRSRNAALAESPPHACGSGGGGMAL